MQTRKYTAIVTVTVVSPEGKLIATHTEDVALELDMNDFANEAGADKFMADESTTLLAAAAANVEGCFD